MRAAFCLLLIGLAALVLAGVPTYNLEVSVNPATRSIVVSGTVTLPAQPKPQSKLFFQLGQQMHGLEMAIVSPASLAQSIKPARINDNQLGSGNFSAELKTPIPAHTAVQIRFSYSGGDKTAFVFRIGPDGTYADGTDFAWYPQFGKEHDQNGKFSVDGVGNVLGAVTYQIPPDLTLIASGKKTVGPRDNNTASFTYRITHPTTFAFTLDKFRVLKSPGRIPVTLYMKEARPNEQEMLQGIRKIVDKESSIFGTFPYPEFALVEIHDESLVGAGFGGAGCPGFMLSSTSFLDGGFNVAFFGHEISHQWWGNEIVHANEAEGNDLLDEAIAQYSSLYMVRNMLGEKAARRYRWSGFPGYVSTQSGLGFLRMAAAGIDIPLGSMPLDQSQLAHELACEKGFLVYHELARTIGETTFHRALQAVTSKYAFQTITWKQFETEIDKSYGKDLSWFWQQWLGRRGAPTLTVTWKKSDGGVRCTVEQPASFYRLSVPVRVNLADGGSKTVEMPLTSERTTLDIPASGAVSSVDLDPDFQVLHFTPESKADALGLVPFTKANWLFFLGKTADGRSALESIVAAPVQADDHGLEFYSRMRLAQILLRVDKNYKEALKQADLAAARPVRDENLMPSYYQIVMTCSDQLGDKARATSAAKSALLAERQLGQHTSVSLAAEKYLAMK